MSTVWHSKTNKGRVVYDRKPHAWNVKDVIRIARQSDIVFFNIPLQDWQTFSTNYQLWFQERSAEFRGFGGGIFAGGGATRSWQPAMPAEIFSSIDKGIMIILREDS